MRFARVYSNGKKMLAVSDNGSDWFQLETIESNAPDDFNRWIENGQTISDVPSSTSSRVTPERFLCPIVAPEKILCVGKNYADHAAEMGSEAPSLPVIFNKLPSTLIGDGEQIVLPAISSKVDYEAELVVVIGKSGKNIPLGDAMDYVFGYCIGNDVTARDWQKGRPGGQWLLGKTFDTFGPLGPYIVSASEVGQPGDLNIQLRLNGQLMQSGNTSNLVFSIDYLISHISKFCTLKPGDLLFTGTPSGVGAGRSPEIYLKSGDEIEISISGLGQLKNSVCNE